ncbi:MAG: hypothetical protein NVS4B3_05780 [Gemmatimonadaceae bacterium]
MAHSLAARRFPHERVLLPRTKLAYVHLRNLLTDAKRDRAARVFGYVAIWLPDALLLLYLQEGEVVNATSDDGRTARAIPIAEALDLVPVEPEYGEITFCEADDEQLACMFAMHSTVAEGWPAELETTNAAALFPYLMATTFDGVVSIEHDGGVNLLIVRDGTVERVFLCGDSKGTLIEKVQHLFARDRGAAPVVERWPVPAPLPAQAPPALIQVYRDLTSGLVQRVLTGGNDNAATIAEHARERLLREHPALQSFSASARMGGLGSVADTPAVTAAVAAWTTEFLWATTDFEASSPEALLKAETWERRHLLQSAGFFERLPWKIV